MYDRELFDESKIYPILYCWETGPSGLEDYKSDQTSPKERVGWKVHEPDWIYPEPNRIQKVSGGIRCEPEKEHIRKYVLIRLLRQHL